MADDTPPAGPAAGAQARSIALDPEVLTVDLMTMDDELSKLRRYTRAEAAGKLNIPEHWLKNWVAQHQIPHRRSGQVRGVWFTLDDILAIGRLMPTLMTPRQANSLAAPSGRSVEPTSAAVEQSETSAGIQSVVSPELEVTDAQIAKYRSLRPTR